MIGGKLIFDNPNTCIFKPSIPCKNEKVKKDHITKISVVPMNKDGSLNEREKKMNQMIMNIKGYDKWALVFDTFCQPKSIEDIAKHDKDIHKCVKGLYGDNAYDEWKRGLFPSDSNKNIEYYFKMNQMMNGRYGGMTLDKYVKKKF